MDSGNGTTEEVSGRFKVSRTKTQRKGLGETRNKSESTGSDSIVAGREDSVGRNIDWKFTPIRDTTTGKIFERIEALEARHIKYVRAHQSRLNARLAESMTEEEEFLQEANQIKSDLYHLAIAQNQSNGNGHIN